MKKSSILITLLLIAVSAGLSGCGTLVNPSSWPGITVGKESAYVAYGPHIYSLKLSSGNEEWRFPTESDSKISYYAKPVLTEDGQLIVGSYSQGGSNGNNISNLDADNGRENWKFDEANNRYISSALVAGGMIYAPNANKTIYKLDIDGYIMSNWGFSADEPLWAQPLLVEETIYVASMDHHLYALNMTNGYIQWTTIDLGSALASAPTYGENGYLYVGTFGSQVYAIKSSSGQVVWSIDTEHWVWESPAYSNGKLFFGDESGTFYVLDAETGDEIWRMEANGAILGTPVIIAGQVYFATETGSVYVLTQDGEDDWDEEIIKNIDGRVLGSLVLAGDLLLIGVVESESDDIVIAIDLSGNQEWSFAP